MQFIPPTDNHLGGTSQGINGHPQYKSICIEKPTNLENPFGGIRSMDGRFFWSSRHLFMFTIYYRKQKELIASLFWYDWNR